MIALAGWPEGIAGQPLAIVVGESFVLRGRDARLPGARLTRVPHGSTCELRGLDGGAYEIVPDKRGRYEIAFDTYSGQTATLFAIEPEAMKVNLWTIGLIRAHVGHGTAHERDHYEQTGQRPNAWHAGAEHYQK